MNQRGRVELFVLTDAFGPEKLQNENKIKREKRVVVCAELKVG